MKKVKSENIKLYLRLYFKRIRDMRLKKKIYWSLILITGTACLILGMMSYKISEKVIVDKSQTMAVNLVKQIGLNLDERINAFADLSYRIMQTTSMNKILYYDEEHAEKNSKDSTEDFRTTILQQFSLYSYTKYALLCPKHGVINEYYKYRSEKLSESQEKKILEYLENCVTIAKPINWVLYENQVYFVRRIVKAGGTDLGIVCFAVTDNFFTFVGTEQDYLTNDDIAILSADKSVLKKHDVGEKQIERITDYRQGNYYVYNTIVENGDERYIAIALNTKVNDWCVIGLISYRQLVKELNYIFVCIIFILLAVIIVAFLVASLISRMITRNVTVIENGMCQYEKGNFSVRLKPVSYDETGMLVLQMNYMGMKINELMSEIKEKEKEKQEAEYQAMLAQINPHFLYNTLGSLKWAAWRRKETETETSIDALIHLLRFTIKKASSILSLEEELEYIRNYIVIEKVRYANAFYIDYEIEEGVLGWRVPGFLLQPFIENALIHGLDMTQENPRIVLRGYQKDDKLCLEIEDNGVGMEKSELENIWRKEKSKEECRTQGYSSIGIRIVESRLKNYYGNHFKIQIFSQKNQGTKVILVIPKKEIHLTESEAVQK